MLHRKLAAALPRTAGIWTQAMFLLHGGKIQLARPTSLRNYFSSQSGSAEGIEDRGSLWPVKETAERPLLTAACDLQP